jgi:hypothetical protein
MKFQKKYKYFSRAVFLFFAVSFVFACYFFVSVKNASANEKCDYIKSEIRPGSSGNDFTEIAKLQYFLNHYEGFYSLNVDGILNDRTIDAVKLFQLKYRSDVLHPWGYEKPTGVVYILTQKKINEIICGVSIPLTQAQLKEIDDFKTSRGVADSVVSKPAVNTTQPMVKEVVKTDFTKEEVDPPVISTVSVNKKIFGGWFPYFGKEMINTAYIFSLPTGLDAFEAFVLFFVVLLVLNVLPSVVNTSKSVVFVVGSLVSVSGFVFFDRPYMIIPFGLVFMVALYIFLKQTFKRNEEKYDELTVDEETVVELIPDIQNNDPTNTIVPMEEPETVIEPAVDLDTPVAPVEEVKIIMGHIVHPNPPEKKN